MGVKSIIIGGLSFELIFEIASVAQTPDGLSTETSAEVSFGLTLRTSLIEQTSYQISGGASSVLDSEYN